MTGHGVAGDGMGMAPANAVTRQPLFERFPRLAQLKANLDDASDIDATIAEGGSETDDTHSDEMLVETLREVLDGLQRELDERYES